MFEDFLVLRTNDIRRATTSSQKAKVAPKFVRRQITMIVACVVLFSGNNSMAQGGKFVPSESEWAVWPQYCQARYVDIPLGQSTQYAGRVSREQISAISSTMTRETFRSLHHHCFAIGYMMRARMTSRNTESNQYSFLLNKVIEESQFTYQRMNLAEPVAADVVYLMAKAHSMLGDFDDGAKLVERVIDAQPELPGAYVALALLYRSDKNTNKAVEILEQALKNVASPSAELYYTAAISYFDEGAFETAQSYAVQAYDLGYPLPGLAQKLAKVGYWPPEGSASDSQ